MGFLYCLADYLRLIMCYMQRRIHIRMATIRKVKVRTKRHWYNPNWDIGAVIVALIGTFLLIVTLLSRPRFEILHHTVILTQGIIAPAVIMGAIVWAIVEYFTPPGHTIEDLLARIIPAFIVGALLGGGFGYFFNFGKYVIEPAFNGNIDAVFFLLSVLIASLAVTWNAAWAHRKGFRGQTGEDREIVHGRESGTSKGRRGMLGLLIIFLVAFLIVPIGASLGNAFVAGHDNSSVLQSQSVATYITGSNSAAVPFASANGTATFSFPSSTSNNITVYDHTVYLRTNLTLAELNNYAVSKFVLATNDKENVNVTLGTGYNKTDFVPIYMSSVTNGSSIAIPVSAAMLTGNQSAPVTFEINANVTAMSLKVSTYGNDGLVTIFGAYPVMQVTYLIGGVLLLVAAFIQIGAYDMNLGLFASAMKKGGRRA